MCTVLPVLNTGYTALQVVLDVGVPSAVDDRKAHLQWRLEELRVIRAGTLSRLVAAMTVDRSGELDSNHVNILLATYRTFATPNDLLAEIIRRYGILLHGREINRTVLLL